MKLTIGMAAFKDFDQIWFTVQVLRLFHPEMNWGKDSEILVVDNFGDDRLRSFIEGAAAGQARYIRYTDRQGTAAPRDHVFSAARGEWVICVDPHILLWPGALAKFQSWADAHPDCRDLLQGPLVYDTLTYGSDRLSGSIGKDGVWGQWSGALPEFDAEPYEIEKMGLGLFGCRRDAWLGFNPEFKGFGGEEGYIHTRYKQAGRRTLSLPFLRWLHLFRNGTAPYPLWLEDKARNTVIGWKELGLDLAPVFAAFGDHARRAAAELARPPRFSVVYYSDLRNPEGVRRYCLDNLRRTVAAQGGEVVEAIDTTGAPSHARLYGQILDGLARTKTDWCFLAEDDVLYPEAHFSGTPGINTFGFNKNVWHLSPKGFFPSDWPGVFLSTCFGHKAALVNAITKKRAESVAGRLVHAEPEGWERTWTTDVPVVDVRHGSNYTGMREHAAPVQAATGWGDAAPLLAAMKLTPA